MWNPTLGGSGAWATWNNVSKGYLNDQSNLANGVRLPVERDIAVYSVMAATTMQTLGANLVYDSVGPYKSGLIRHFDPTVAADRTAAASTYCQVGGCDYTLRVKRNGVWKPYMLPAANVYEGVSGSHTMKGNSLVHSAINFRQSDGVIQSVVLLSTPNAQVNGLPSNPQVLYTWGS